MIIECVGTPPIKGSEGAAGYDLKTVEGGTLFPRSSNKFDTGLKLAIPKGYVGKVKSRSGLSFNHSVEVGAGTIDSDYRGSIRVHLYNHSQHILYINPGDRIAQLLIQKVEEPTFMEVDELDATVRGEGGFGHTGRN